MSREARLLRKKNNARDKEISPENEEIYTNMVVYMRSSDITEYNQEKVREDLINMIVDGQNRGEDIQKVMGGNYKEICDGIIQEMPKKTKTEKIMDIVMITLDVIWILGLIAIIKSVITSAVSDKNFKYFSISLGELISFVIIAIAANLIVNVVCKTAFDDDKGQKAKNKVLYFLVYIVVFSAIILPPVFLTQALFTIHVGIAALLVAVAFLINRLLAVRF